MDSLLVAIVTWLAVNFGLPPDYDFPKVVRLPDTELVEIRYADVEPSKRRDVVALYDDATETILLSDTWTGRSAADLSVIVHEMVHHLQKRAQLRYACENEREKEAYAAQDAWLQLFGLSLETEFNIDRPTLKLSTNCMLP